MSIKNKIIKKLGGYTREEYRNKDEDTPAEINVIPICVDVKSYYVDEDTMEVEKEQLAYKIGKALLDYDLISYSIKTMRDHLGLKIYRVRAKTFVAENK